MSASSDRNDALPTLLTIHDIARLLRVRRTTAYARTREWDFPDPHVISGACYRWYAHEVLGYLETRRAPKKVYRSRAATVPAQPAGQPGVMHSALPPARSRAKQRGAAHP